jgi:hypothetical protein
MSDDGREYLDRASQWTNDNWVGTAGADTDITVSGVNLYDLAQLDQGQWLNLFHGALQSVLQATERIRPGLGVLAHPPVVDEADRDGVQEVELLAASPLGDHQTG